MNILFAGFGDIAQKTASLLDACSHDEGSDSTKRSIAAGETTAAEEATYANMLQIHALSKTPKNSPQQKRLLSSHHLLDLADPESVRVLLAGFADHKLSIDYLFIILAPSGLSALSREERYRRSYLAPVNNLCSHWPKQLALPKHCFFSSSTSVYHQSDGSLVDEDSPVEPAGESARLLLETERCLAASRFPSTIVRFSGIYAEDRQYLVRSVRQGARGSDTYSNRIHADDAAGVLAFLLTRHREGNSLAPLYLASDSHPSTSRDVCAFIARQLGLSEASDHSLKSVQSPLRGGNKRCSNRRLLDAGYRFVYPSYREGYAFLAQESS